MTHKSISISNYVNVNTVLTGTGIEAFNPNNIAFFTTEAFVSGSPNDDFRTYLSATAVGSDFGITSETYKLANTLFSQSPNIRAGRGQLKIIPLQNIVQGTVAKFTTTDLSTNLANIQAIADGYITITDTAASLTFNLENLDFTKAQNLTDVAEIFLDKIEGYIAVNIVGNTLEFTSKRYGTDGAIALQQYAGGTGTDLTVANLFNTGSGIITAGVNTTGETIIEAKARIGNTVNYVGFFTNKNLSITEILSIAADTQSKAQIYLQGIGSIADVETNGVALSVVASKFTKTRLLPHFKDLSLANSYVAAFIGRGFSVDYAGSNTTLIMNAKPITGVLPDTAIDDSLLAKCKTAGVYSLPDTAGAAIVNAQTNKNEYFSNIHDEIAFSGTLQVVVYNLLLTTVTKIPQNTTGALRIQNAIESVCIQFKRNQMITEGLNWGGDTFGSRESFITNIKNTGYYIYFTPFTEQSAEDRAAGIVNFQVAAKLAGGVRTVNIQAILEQ